MRGGLPFRCTRSKTAGCSWCSVVLVGGMYSVNNGMFSVLLISFCFTHFHLMLFCFLLRIDRDGVVIGFIYIYIFPC